MTPRRRWAERALTTLGASAAAGLVAGSAVAPVHAASTAALAAPMPSPAVVAQGVSSANPAHLFRSRPWDFRVMGQVFNTVALLPGDPTAVDAARAAGLAVVLELDYKADFFAGKDIGAKVAAVVAQVKGHPGTISAIHVADRLNERYSAAQGLRYLAATGGVFHRDIPGVPVLVNASDWQLTCGLRGQSGCGSHGVRFQYETDATVDAFVHSGYVDGISLADNLKNNDPVAQTAAWRRARARWPAPFVLWATCSQLSFGTATYQGDPPAATAAKAYVTAPLQAGASAVALWAWHQLYNGQVDSFLDKDGSGNAVWSAMQAASHTVGLRPTVAAPAGFVTRAPPARHRPVAVGAAVAVAVVVAVVGGAVVATARRRRRPRPAPPPGPGA